MEATKIKVGTVVSRWNGMSNDKGVVFSTTKKEATVMWKGIKEKVEKDTLKWQKKYNRDKKEWDHYWKAPTTDIKEVLTTKVEDGWMNTYNQAGELVSKRIYDPPWFTLSPRKIMELSQISSVSDKSIKDLDAFYGEGSFLEIYDWFCMACYDERKADDVIKWMVGPLKEIMKERNSDDFVWGGGVPFHAPDFGLFVEKTVNKEITATMGKDVLRRMFDDEKLEEIIKDDKYKISSDDDMLKFVKDVIETNPSQVEEYKGGKEKVLGWLVGQVMKISRGKANAGEVKEMLKKELDID